LSVAALLTLADSRLPAGGHAHSGGVEEACALGLVTDEASLETFLARRLTTAGAVAASLAAAAWHAAGGAVPPDHGPAHAPGSPGRAAADPSATDPWAADPSATETAAADRVAAGLAVVEREADARTPSPALRAASRAQGRGLVRLGRVAWPDPVWDGLPRAPHHPVALGVAARAAGLRARDAALAAAYLAVSGPATAAQRLLGMDPMKVAAATARLAPAIDDLADRAPADPPAAWTDPLLDLLAERHATRRERYFAS
jgi:urease accessory protein